MKNFLDNRVDNRIASGVNLQPDAFNDISRMSAMFNLSKNKALEAESSVDFLETSLTEVEESIDKGLSSLEDKISYLISAVTHINKIKVSAASTSKEVDVKLVNLTAGYHENMSYSSTDGGLIMSTINTTSFRE